MDPHSIQTSELAIQSLIQSSAVCKYSKSCEGNSEWDFLIPSSFTDIYLISGPSWQYLRVPEPRLGLSDLWPPAPLLSPAPSFPQLSARPQPGAADSVQLSAGQLGQPPALGLQPRLAADQSGLQWLIPCQQQPPVLQHGSPPEASDPGQRKSPEPCKWKLNFSEW